MNLTDACDSAAKAHLSQFSSSDTRSALVGADVGDACEDVCPTTWSAKTPPNEATLETLSDHEHNETGTEIDFDPTQCLFCNRNNPSLDSNLEHMRKLHGLFIADPNHLKVDLETLLAYFHLVIFGYFECLHCSVQRQSASAAQQHMLAKGHCNFDLAREDSEFRDFYNTEFQASQERKKEWAEKAALTSPQPGKHRTQRHQRHQRELEIGISQPEAEASTLSPAKDSSLPPASIPSLNHALTKTERRNLHAATQLTQLRESDRRSIMHLPSSQQRALLATHKQQVEQARRDERRARSRVETMGNKALMKHFVPDVPGRLNG